MTEVIKEIYGFEGRYTISNLGIVRSLLTNKVMKLQLTKFGYLRVNLRYANSRKFKSFFVHRLVAKHFLDNPNNLQEINHIDCNKTNNIVTNLEWCSREYNIKYSYDHGSKTSKGFNNGNCKITKKTLEEIKELLQDNKFSHVKIAKLYNVSSSTIDNIANNKTKFI